MEFDAKKFWQRLVDHKLLDENTCSVLRTQFESDSNGESRDVENLANWLIQQKAISTFQANILQSESPGPVVYGNYLIVEGENRLGDQPKNCRFRARHLPTNHRVQLEFFAGSHASDLERWRQAKLAAKAAQSSPHRNLQRIFETVAIPEYRFVVSEILTGKTVAKKIPLDTRISHRQAAKIVFQVSSALNQLRALGLEFGELTDENIRIEKNGNVKIQLPISNSLDTQQSQKHSENVFSLGTIWYRIVSGRLPKKDSAANEYPKSEFVRLKKYEMPIELTRLVKSMLANNVHDRSDFEAVSASIENEIPEVSQVSPAKKCQTLAAFNNWLTRIPIVGDRQYIESSERPNINIEDNRPSDLQSNSIDPDEFLPSSTTGEPESSSAIRPTRSRMWVPLSGSIATVVVILGTVVSLTFNQPNKSTTNDQKIQLESKPEDQNLSTELAKENLTESQIATEEAYVKQNLLNDDGQSLWETPTTGKPVDLAGVPRAPKIVTAIRLSELLQSNEGAKIIQALGPAWNQKKRAFSTNIGFEFAEIERLLLSLHTNSDLRYDPFFVVTLKDEIAVYDLIQKWNQPKPISDGELNYFERDANTCFAITLSNEKLVKQFAVGSKELVIESLELGGLDISSGSMKRLIRNSDQDRHFNIFVLRSGLFDDAGQALMGDSLANFNRQLSLAINQFIRGFSFSFHLDEGTFVELKLDQAADLKDGQLANDIRSQLTSLENEISNYTTNMNSNSYWDKVRLRFAGMIANFNDNLRIGIESKSVVGNGWYAPSAMQNWIAAAELTLAFGESQQAKTNSHSTKTVPQTLEELLSIPRDLAVSTSPDLVILMQNLQQEIIDDYGSLPFDFEIRLMGADLSIEGITQNQRPSDFELRDTPLSDILTEIMVKANPDKNVTGPDDVACKMVWVVANDPSDESRKIVLITTRAAAIARSYQLPPAFIAK